MFDEEQVESHKFILHKIERVFGARYSLADFIEEQAVMHAKRHGAARHGILIKLEDPVQVRSNDTAANDPDFGSHPHFAVQVLSCGP